MSELDREEVIARIRQIVIEDCDKDVAPEEIRLDEQLIGGELDLDSLDALQICMTVKNIYDVRIESGPESRRALQSVNTLADTIIETVAGR